MNLLLKALRGQEEAERTKRSISGMEGGQRRKRSTRGMEGERRRKRSTHPEKIKIQLEVILIYLITSPF